MSDWQQKLGEYRVSFLWYWIALPLLALLALFFGLQTALLFVLILLGLAAWVVWKILLTPQYVLLYREGMQLRFVNRQRNIAWDQVQQLWIQGFRSDLALHVWFVDSENRAGSVQIPLSKNKDSNILSFAQLHQQISERTLVYRLEQAKQQFAQGQRIHFAQIQASVQGLYQGNQFLAWRHMQLRHRDEVILITDAHGIPWLTLIANEINDPDVLLALIDELGRE